MVASVDWKREELDRVRAFEGERDRALAAARHRRGMVSCSFDMILRVLCRTKNHDSVIKKGSVDGSLYQICRC
jgi:hypothetical protein